MQTLLRYGPFVTIVAFFAVGVGARSLVQRRRHGSWGFAMSPRAAAGALLLPLVALAQAAALARWPERLALLTSAPGLRFTGAAIAVSATIAMVVAQLDLGASWRIGIEHGVRPGLVMDGLYAACRNPIFAFMLAGLAGLTLFIPTVLSLALFIAAFVATEMQVRREEAWLTATYGDAYRAYARRVGRFSPWTGHL